MGNLEARFRNALLSVKKQIEIEGSGTPSLTVGITSPSMLGFDLQHPGQQCAR